MEQQPLLEMRQINKSFPGVQALRDVDLTVHPGEILALLGENGAGKSTLMKVLNGVYAADSGQIIWDGNPVTIHSPHEAQDTGISMIHQELALIPHLNAGKNIYLGREPSGVIPGLVNWGEMYRDAQSILTDIGLDINARRPVRHYSLAQQQMIEVAKALSRNARLIVMDEPTSSLTDREVQKLFDQMRQLKERGVAIIFISHRLEEVFEICDRITVLRDGELVGSNPITEVTRDDIIRMMVGREVGEMFEPRARRTLDEQVLQVRNLSRGTLVQDVSFTLHSGEVLGIAGLVGAGRTELAETLFGAHPASSGDIILNGKPVRIKNPAHAIRHGLGFVPEDRKREGLFLGMTVALNIVITRLIELLRGVFVDWRRVRSIGQEYVSELDIRTPGLQQRVRNLSGGNQQKVVIAKWLTMNPSVLILDEPTRGIDVGAKTEIYRLINRLAQQGVGIIVISSELPEILGISDRILVMREGRVTGEFDAKTATQDMLMRAAVDQTVQ